MSPADQIKRGFLLAQEARRLDAGPLYLRAREELLRAEEVADASLFLDLSIAYLELDDLDRASKYYLKHVIIGSASDSRAMAVASEIALREGRFSEALSLADSALIINSELCMAALVKCRALHALGMGPTIGTPSIDVCRSPRERAEIAYLHGLEALDAGLAPNAMTFFSYARSRDPGGRIGRLAAERLSEIRKD